MMKITPSTTPEDSFLWNKAGECFRFFILRKNAGLHKNVQF